MATSVGLAENLLQRLRREGLSTGMPADLDEVAAWCGAQVEVQADLMEEGLTMWTGGTPLIALRSAPASTERARFTFAHELGHVIAERYLRCHGAPDNGAVRFDKPDLERLCDEIAGALLLPRDLVLHAASPQPTLPQARYLALRGAVSLSCTAVRMRRLGLPVRLLRLSIRPDSVDIDSGVGFRKSDLLSMRLDEASRQAVLELPIRRDVDITVRVHRGDACRAHTFACTARRTPFTCVLMPWALDGRPAGIGTNFCDCSHSLGERHTTREIGAELIAGTRNTRERW